MPLKVFCFLPVFLASIHSFAACKNLFDVNEEFISAEFGELQKLENNLWEEMMVSPANEYMLNFFSPRIILSSSDSLLLGIPSFFWGFVPGYIGGCIAPLTYGTTCLLGLGGTIEIYIHFTEAKREARTSETLKAAIGCVAGTTMGLLTVIAMFYALMGEPLI